MSKMRKIRVKCRRCYQEDDVPALHVRFYVEMRDELIPCDRYLDGFPCEGRAEVIEHIEYPIEIYE